MSDTNSWLILILILSVPCFLFVAPAYSQSIHASENPLPVGSNVTLFSPASVTTGAWMFNNNIIVMIFPGDKIITNTWNDRVTFNTTTSSLTIRSLQVENSGLYTLQALNLFRAQLTLSVQGKDHFMTFHVYLLPIYLLTSYKCTKKSLVCIHKCTHLNSHSTSPLSYR